MSKFRIAIIGAGAIGGWVGASLSRAGHDVSFVARSATLAALQERGIGLRQGEETRFYPCRASANPQDLGEQDLVIIAVKAHALTGLASRLPPLLGPQTAIIPMLNGVPWWFMGPKHPLQSVDPDGTIAASLPVRSLIGCVTHAALSSPEPGLSVLHFCDRLIIGEPGGGMSGRVHDAAELLRSACIPTDETDDIRTQIWFKLLGNMTMNPMSAITQATTDRLIDDPYIRELVISAMEEARQLGAMIGCRIEQTGEMRLAVTRKLGDFKTSMLQDLEAGRSLELDALLGAPIEIAALKAFEVPVLRGLFGLARTLARSRNLY